MKKTYIAQIVAALMAGAMGSGAHAAAFQLLEQNASGVGNAFAGSGAAAEDASTAYFNPAAMPFMAQPSQVSMAIDLVKPTIKFHNNGSTTGLMVPASKAGGDGGDAGSVNVVPDLHITYALNDKMSLGFSFGAPFGLKTDYDPSWIGRFQATLSDIKTYNANPSFAYKFAENFSVGAGVSYQRMEATLEQAVNFGALAGATLCPTLSPACLGQTAPLVAGKEGSSSVEGDSTAWGWNLGAAWQVSQSTRVGLSYRSAIKHNLTGDVSFVRPTFASAGLNAGIAAKTPDGPVSVDVKLPDTWILSTFQQINDQWSLQGDISWTGWSSIKTLDIYRSNGTLLASSYYNWKDTWRVALGGGYQMSPELKLRAGVAYDQSPVEDQYRTPRMPDNNRTWLSLGMNYKFTPVFSVDAGYSHLFLQDTSINDSGYHADYNPGGINSTNPVVRGTLKGDYTGSVDILAVQANYAF